MRLIDAKEVKVIYIGQADGTAKKYVPVKHGKWESGITGIKPHVTAVNDIRHCPECKCEAYFDTEYGTQLFDFCPNCGARMDGE